MNGRPRIEVPADVLDRLEAGTLTYAMAAAETGINRCTIRNRMREAGRHAWIGPRVRANENRLAAMRLHRDGVTLQDIASTLGVTRERVRQYIRQGSTHAADDGTRLRSYSCASCGDTIFATYIRGHVYCPTCTRERFAAQVDD